MNSPFTKLWLKIIQHVICKNDQEAFEYLKGWMAFKIQKPSEPLRVAIAMPNNQSAQAFADLLFGLHSTPGHEYKAVDLRTNPSALVKDATFVVADERVVQNRRLPERIRDTGAAVLLLCNRPIDFKRDEILILDHKDDVPEWLRPELYITKKEMGSGGK